MDVGKYMQYYMEKVNLYFIAIYKTYLADGKYYFGFFGYNERYRFKASNIFWKSFTYN